MGGQRGGMRNELGRFPEVCKKSLQAMAADLSPSIPASFYRANTIESLRSWTPRALEAAGRLVHPLMASPGDAHFRPVSWQRALEAAASAFRGASADASFFYASGRSSNEAGFLLQLFARERGTNNVNNCSYYCHQASGAGLKAAIGTGTATVDAEDVEHADCFLLIGGNPASNHPRLMSALRRVRRRGGSVIVVNPAKERGLVAFRIPSSVSSMTGDPTIASHYVMPHIGGDIAVLTGMAKRLVDTDAVDQAFLAAHATGGDALLDHVARTSWAEVEAASGVPRAELEAAADAYAKAERAVFGWTMGITHHRHGTENVQWIVNLALLRGMVGRPGAGLLPIRGHSNVQGMGTIGVTPRVADAVVARLAERRVVSPPEPGLDTMACMEAAHAGTLRVGLALGGNLYGSNPDAAFASAALSELDTMIYLSTTLNTGHVHGTGKHTIILPVLARDEEPMPTTQESMFNYVRLSDGGAARHEGPRSEIHVVAGLAGRVNGEAALPWRRLRDPDAVRALIADTVPSLEPLRDIGRTKAEFTIPGRHLTAPRFLLPEGKARLFAHPIPAGPPLGERELRLMTVRSEGQFNTVVYEEEDPYRGQDRRDVLLLNPADMTRLDLAPDDRVRVRSETGHKIVLARPFDVRAGNAIMYYPEANDLVPRHVDPVSRTPAFKHVRVTVERA